MGFKSALNMASKFHNKILLSVLSIGILFVLVIENFNPLEFSDFNLNLVIVLWTIFFLISLLYSVNGIVLHKGFLHQIKESENQGKPIKGMRGYDQLISSLENARNTSILISLASFLSLVVFISSMMDVGLFSEAGRNTIVTIAVSMTFLTTTVVFLVEYPREASMEPGSLIGYYEPEIYPMILDNILSDAFKTFLDPISLMAYDDWVSFIGEHLEYEFEPDSNSNTRLERAVEKILLLSYLSQTMPNIVNEDTIATEISEVIGNHNLDGFYEGAQSGLSWDEIRSMMLLMEEQCPDVLRLVDRLIIELQENYDDFTSRDTYFTVSGKTSQGTIRDVSGAIVFLLNNTKNEDRKMCVEFRSDMSSVHPEYQKMNIILDPMMTSSYPEQKPPFIDDGEDMLSIVNDLLQIGDAVWFRFKSSSFGYKALTFQAEEVATGLTFGRSVEMRFKKSILWYVKTFAPRLSAFGGVLLPVIQASLFA
jgi:hypothetical protein